MTVHDKLKHALHCCFFLFIIGLMEYLTLGKPNVVDSSYLRPWEKYGVFFTCVLYGLRFVTLLPLPQATFNFVGMIFYNTFPGKVVLRSSPLLSPLICVRVVTRGDYPQLVKDNVARNMKTCLDTGLENFYIEVVSDQPLNLPCNPRIRELVVPEEYNTSSGAMYKARALQYCLEEKNNMLSDNDWIVHLDEETLLTPNCLRGILNFALDGKYDIGQGLITYANEEIVNWFTTLADGFRVADDMGKLQFQFKMFHKPLFSFKGSYVVTQYGTEKAVSFDNGPDGSIAEDCFFAIKAFSEGYSFNFIEGEMWEKSPFTLKDLVQQRKRWLQGILLVVHSKALPWKCKILLTLSCYAWVTIPLAVSNIILVPLYPLPSFLVLDSLMSFVGAVNIYMFIFGALKSFNLKRYGVFKYFLCLIGSVAVIPVNALLEITAVMWGYFGRKHVFYIVRKGTTPTEDVV
ncbi:beta-1,4-mannosyltransferase egh isoform X2 [Dendroctonus ponderosae]|nr:beta-1,4-mannosyltransferase egh isoform X2 [Dendroctonus ponderosae]XP_019765969.2 beta-1,4-mannosyltransferase egh isoform X2 [Dendroctonus ponderosae]XP_048523391.1 beta-1,4-mannosyltransferase egh isoform X2 [Dendroctonus ponderosae]